MAYTKADLTDEITRLKSRIASLEGALERSERDENALRDLLEDLPVLIWTTDCNLVLQSVSGVFAGEMDRSPDEAAGMTIQAYFGVSDPTFLPMAAAMRALGGETLRYSTQIRGRLFQAGTGPMYDGTGKIAGTVTLAFDISEQHAVETRVHDAEGRYRDLVDSISEMVLWYDQGGTIVLANAAAERILQYSGLALRGRPVTAIVAEESRRVFLEKTSAAFSGTDSGPFQVAFVSESGRRVTAEVSLRIPRNGGAGECVQAIGHDLTQRRRIDEQMRQAQKMQAIGVLAGGIAHDFNNLLTGILGYAYLLEADEKIRHRHSDAIGVIIRSSERAAQLTSKLLSFARRGKAENMPTDLHSTVRDVVDLLQRTIDKRIRITASLRAPQSYVLGDPTQLYQLLLNLCLNARDAISDGGDIRICTKNSGSSVVLSVQDTGSGIPDDIRDRIFEPFFTTKEPNKGTGMGLAMVHGITTNHGGAVHLDTEAGVGTTFYVTFPTCDPAGRPVPVDDEVVRGHGTVLVIDDEPVVRQVLSRMLSNLGYEVETAGDSKQALAYYREHVSHIDAVILDIVMPKMSGRDCLAELRQINPNVRAVLTSGLPPDDAHAIIEAGNVEYLQKPYQMQDLAGVVRRAVTKETAHNA